MYESKAVAISEIAVVVISGEGKLHVHEDKRFLSVSANLPRLQQIVGYLNTLEIRSHITFINNEYRLVSLDSNLLLELEFACNNPDVKADEYMYSLFCPKSIKEPK